MNKVCEELGNNISTNLKNLVGKEISQEDSWARVELYRWQHGELPFGDDKSLDESKALLAMADAIEKGCKSGNIDEMPTPFNVVSVMRYIAKKI